MLNLRKVSGKYKYIIIIYKYTLYATLFFYMSYSLLYPGNIPEEQLNIFHIMRQARFCNQVKEGVSAMRFSDRSSPNDVTLRK